MSQQTVRPQATANIEDAKRVAKRILEKYQAVDSRGVLRVQDIPPILRDVYDNCKTTYRPSQSDNQSYHQLLDYNKDSRVTLEDLEQICIKYLCNYTTSNTNAVTFVHEQNNVVSGEQPKQSSYTSHYTTSNTYTNNYSSSNNYANNYTSSPTNHYSSNTYTTNNYQQSNNLPGQYQSIQQSQRVQQYNSPSYNNYNQGISNLIAQNYNQEYSHPDPYQFKPRPPADKQQGHPVQNTTVVFNNPEKTNLSQTQVQKLRQRSLVKGQPRRGPEFERVLAQYRGRKFTDSEFPPQESSLSKTGRWYDDGPIPYTGWIRASDFYNGQQQLFYQAPGDAAAIMPGDIAQGELGDCYLQCTLAALAEWPNRVQKLFTTNKPNQEGVYSVWVCWTGVWKEVILDDNLWYNPRGQMLVSMQCQQNEIWPQLAEKAWAKLNGDYCSIDGGFARDCLHDFTGAPVIHFRIKEQQNWQKWQGILFDLLKNGEDKDHIMCAGTYGEDPTGNYVGDTSQRNGIFYSHAYTVLGAYQVGQEQLIKFRNPHGEGEWSGTFSDRDQASWSRVSQADKDRIGYSNDDDGIFFMRYSELRTYFEDVQICFYDDNKEYQGTTVQTSHGDVPHYFQVQITKPGEYYFQVNQQAKAMVDEQLAAQNRSSNYRYTQSTIAVADQNGQLKVACKGRQKNITSNLALTDQSKGYFQPGTYNVMVKVKFDQTQAQAGINSFGFGVYGVEGGFSISQEQRQAPQGLANPQITEVLPSFVI